MFNFTDITEALIACDEDKVLALVKDGLNRGLPAKDILARGLIRSARAGVNHVAERDRPDRPTSPAAPVAPQEDSE